MERNVLAVDDGRARAAPVTKALINNRSLFSGAVSIASADISLSALQNHLMPSLHFLATRPLLSLQHESSSDTTLPHFSPSEPTIIAPRLARGALQGWQVSIISSISSSVTALTSTTSCMQLPPLR